MFSEFLSQNLIWAAAFVIIANLLVLSLIQGRVKGANMVSALELPKLQRSGSSIIIDVNETKDYATAHIPDAINFPASTITAEDAALLKLKDKTTILVCQTGSKSLKAAKTLVSMGFNDLHILRGGMVGWTKENLPTTSK